MNTIRYSYKTGAAYPAEISYKNLPDDIGEISISEYFDILKERAETNTAPMTVSEAWAQIKQKRDRLIEGVMWEYERYNRESRLRIQHKRSDEWMHNLDLYIQALADIPQNFSTPDDVVWPVHPGN